MNIECIKNVYTFYKKDENILERIQSRLKEMNVDEISINNNKIDFNNNFIGKRSNFSMMSSIDSGYFELIEKDNHLIVEFSFRRVLIFWLIVSIVVFIVNINNLLIAFSISAFLSLGILVAIVRFKMFVKNVINELTKNNKL